MLHIDIICVGKLKETYLKEAIAEYTKRLSKYCLLTIQELDDEKVPANSSEKEKLAIMEKESTRISSRIKENSYVVALDLKGKQYSSEEFAKKIEEIALHTNSSITFLIGGSLGMSQNLLNFAHEKICFSKMTFPHQLIRIFLVEQLFRCFKIQNGETYHH